MKRLVSVILTAVIMLTAAATAGAEQYSHTLKTSLSTDDFMGPSERGRNYSVRVSPLSQFADERGRIGFAYGDENYVYIERLTSKLTHEKTLKIKKLYPLLGAVTCDSVGNYYIVWGQNDTKGAGGVETIAVTKYDAGGKFVKTAAIKSSNAGGMSYNDTQYPFHSGNCDVAINNGVLVCSYARKMYNGHQSNAIVAVTTGDMNLLYDYTAYTSHSFDQRVIYSDKYGTFVFADHGDCFPRGFKLSYSVYNTYGMNDDGRYTECEFTPFHFYYEPEYMNDMYKLNQTNAELGGIGELSTGLVLVGASAKSYSANYTNERRQLFIQIFSLPAYKPEKYHWYSSYSYDLNSVSFVTSGNRGADKGVKWLTDYKTDYAENPQMVIAGDKVVVLWERYDKNHRFLETRYAVVSANGEVLKKSAIGKVRLNAFEEPQYIGGKIYWVTANGAKAVVNELIP